jgi:hypothetical protein
MKEKQDYKAMAKLMWDGFNENEKTGVRFGLFPSEAMKQAAESWGYTDGRELALALMDEAKKDGGMRA